MITRFTKPKELVAEFKEDRERARYWRKKMIAKEGFQSKSFNNLKKAFYSNSADKRSQVFEYDSPQFANKWLVWWRFISRGFGIMPEFREYEVLYRMTDKSVEIMIPTRIVQQDGEIMRGVSIYTDHLFQRLADEDRLGVDLTDRINVIKNFVEIAVLGLIDIRDPRPGERDKQVISRLPKSFLKGHYIPVGDSYIIRFNTFIPEKSMTPSQKKFVKSFASQADNTKESEIKAYFKQAEDSLLNI